MKYLEELGFTKNQIKTIKCGISDCLIDAIKDNKELIKVNLDYLDKLGVTNFREIFVEYYEIFLLEPSAFRAIFDRYDTESLIQKLAEDIRVIEFL